jgi:tetratricopeptide (TPR) repeat protein
MRFRASSEINQIIRNSAENFRIPVAEVEALFIHNSKLRVPGKNLFLEHLHPNPSGYMLIARGFVEAVAKTKLLPKSKMLPQPDGAYLSSAGFTLLDQIIGDLKIQQLVKHYPFNGRSTFEPIKVEEQKLTQIALDHVKKKILWDEAHYQLGDYYLEQDLPYKALAEYRAVSISYPDLFTPYYKVGKVAVTVENYYQAERNFKKAIELNPDAHFLYAKLGIILITRKKFKEARDILENLIERENVRSTLDDIEMLEANYLLGVAYAQNGQISEAKKMLQAVLARKADHVKAQDLLRQIEAYKGE